MHQTTPSPPATGTGLRRAVVATRELEDFKVAVTGCDQGVVVQVRSPQGRTLLARATGARRTVGEHEVGLSADQRHQLRVNAGQEVVVDSVEIPAASLVRIVPTFAADLTQDDQRALSEKLLALRAPLQNGDRFRTALSATSATGVFQVTDVQSSDGESGFVDEGTAVQIRNPTLAQLARFGDDVSLDDVGGLHRVLPALREVVEVPLLRPQLYTELGIIPPRGVLLYGPPGGGKSYVARALARDLGVHFESINGPELVGGSYGQTEANLRQLFSSAAAATPALVLIDEIDAIAPKRGQVGTQTDYRMVTQLLTLMDGLRRLDGVIVVATTNRPDALDAAIRRPGRFDSEIFVGPPDASERLEILHVYADRMPLSGDARAALDELADATNGWVPADLMALTREAALQVLRRLGPSAFGPEPDLRVQRDDLLEAQARVRPSLLRGAAIRPPAGRIADVIGREAVVGRLEAAAGRAGEENVRLLFTGPSGSGKTFLVDALADRLGAHLLHVSPADLFTSWLGETEEALRALFQLATFVAPVVVALDRLEGLAPRRDAGASAAVRRVVDQLLHELDALDRDVHVAATTDDLDAVDPAIRRRFTAAFELSLPSDDERRSWLARARPDLSPDQVAAVVDQTAGGSFATLAAHPVVTGLRAG